MLMSLCHFKLYFLLVAFYYGLLITFANNLEPDQAQRNIGLILMIIQIVLHLDDNTEGFTKVDFTNQQMTKKHANIHVCNVKIC